MHVFVDRMRSQKGGNHIKNLAIFLLCFTISLGGGYLFFGGKAEVPSTSPQTQSQPASPQQEVKSVDAQAASTSTASAPKEGEVFTKLGCISCHSVKNLEVKGGAVGPDLSHAYKEVEGKHGVKIEEFLKKPTSAVMSGVIGGKPLSDEERKAVLEALKKASEKN